MAEALTSLRPKLLCVEYNAKFPPPTSLVMAYSEKHEWAPEDYFGASLQGWVDHLPGYTLVACNLSGANAFFVRNDLAHAFTIYAPALLYQPARYWLVAPSGHAASLKWLKQGGSVATAPAATT